MQLHPKAITILFLFCIALAIAILPGAFGDPLPPVVAYGLPIVAGLALIVSLLEMALFGRDRQPAEPSQAERIIVNGLDIAGLGLIRHAVQREQAQEAIKAEYQQPRAATRQTERLS